MNTTELKALAEKATPGPWVNSGFRVSAKELGYARVADTEYDNESMAENAAYIAAANPAAILELIAAHEDAQGEIRVLRATEQNLRERVKALEEGLRLCVHTIELANWGDDFTARNARALLEQKP